MAYTYVELEISAAAYQEIADKLQSAGYSHAFHAREDGNGYNIDMHGIAVCKEQGHGQQTEEAVPEADAGQAT